MRIHLIDATNFLGLPHAAVRFPTTLNMIAGPNGSGKTSLIEALRFALTGDRPRGVKTKAELSSLLTEGQTTGTVSVTVSNGEAPVLVQRSVKTAETTGPMPKWLASPYLEFVLNASAFARMSGTDRRAFLYALMGVSIEHTEVAKLLADRGVPEWLLDEITPNLRSGMDYAADLATTRAAEARGAWKSITGETYGDKKAADWVPASALLTDSGELAAAEEKAAAARQANDTAHERLAVLKDRLARATEYETHHKRAATLDDLTASRERGLAKRTTAADKLEAIKVELAKIAGTACVCPACERALVFEKGALRVAENTIKPPMMLHADLHDAEKALAEIEARLSPLAAKIAAAEASRTLIAEAPPAVTQEDVDAAQKAADTAMHAWREAVSIANGVAQAKSLADRARDDADRAKREHERVQAWKRAAELLQPDGIPALLLTKALEPFNERLAKSSRTANWRETIVTADMTITFGGRPYALLSESQQWRVDALIADAIAKIGGVRLLVLDRFDVLDLESRADALDWAESIADDYDTIIFAGTLKQKPEIEGWTCTWMLEANTMASAT